MTQSQIDTTTQAGTHGAGASDGSTYDAARDKAHDAARQTAETIESNPLSVLVGGLALGALAGAVLPRSQREKELLAPVGRKVNATAVAALAAAKEVGRQELESRGLTATGAKEQARSLFKEVTKAASNAGKAAAQAGREQATSA